MERKKISKKGRLLELTEFFSVCAVFRLAQTFPPRAGHAISRVLGHALYAVVPKRRRIALENLRRIYAKEKSEREVRALARRSCYSFIASMFETAKLLSYLRNIEESKGILAARLGLEPLLQKAKQIHDQTGGCVFVTPHIGNWEFLPYFASSVGIPLIVVARRLDNRYLENLLYQHRVASGQLVIAKTNSMYFLQAALRQGKSVGMLPDQSTMKAIAVDYLGRKATTTPVPALLAILYHRPIVVVACCRKSEDFRYDGFVSDPIWPTVGASEKAEIFRLTEAMNREMGKIVYQRPEQYFWMHDRWKRYSSTGQLFGDPREALSGGER
jgi:KDO2-lipid IV(A) lauroyltransferase